MDTDTYLTTVADESARLHAALRRADLDHVVPSTPGWRAADLAWHIGEVQWFWGAIVADLLDDDGVEALVEPDRPDGAEVRRFARARTSDLVAALHAREAHEVCWSWHEDGGTVGWVARRQAHEALIHRVDAELVAGGPVTAVDPRLAADGVDELLRVMLGVPGWTTFTPEPSGVTVVATDTDDRWALTFGRATGTSPNSGHDLDVETVAPVEAPVDGAAEISGTAWDLDRWLWGRGPIDPLRVVGDLAHAHRLREIAEVE